MDKIGILSRKIVIGSSQHGSSGAEDDSVDPQLMRLDNMLQAEGVAAPDKASGAGFLAVNDSAIEHADYRAKLAEIRQTYEMEIERFRTVIFCFSR